MTDQPFNAAEFMESLSAGWACRAWFCRDRGPFIVATLAGAKACAEEHNRQRFLRLFRHDAVAYELSAEQKDAGMRLAAFLRTGQFPPKPE